MVLGVKTRRARAAPGQPHSDSWVTRSLLPTRHTGLMPSTTRQLGPDRPSLSKQREGGVGAGEDEAQRPGWSRVTCWSREVGGHQGQALETGKDRKREVTGLGLVPP